MDTELKNLETRLQKLEAGLAGELGGVRTNRPSPKLVEDLKVEAYGQTMPVKQLGSVTVVPPRGLQITVWDQGVAGPVARAVEQAGIGASINQEGVVIHVNLPPLSEERRKELIKLVKAMAEKCRIQIRAARDEFNKKIKQAFDNGEVGEDVKFKTLENIQKATEKFNNKVDKLLEEKIKQLND